jgi:hypothetical protein
VSTLADRAEMFAREALADRRSAGAQDPLDAHAAGVPGILRSIGVRDELVAAGYLYRLIGNTTITFEHVEREFGAPVAALVCSVVGARGTDAVGGGRLAFADADVQTLVLAADLATLREAHELTPRVRKAVIDGIRLRAARLLQAHLYLQYEVRQTLVQWQWQWQRRTRATGVESPGADAQPAAPGTDAVGAPLPPLEARCMRCLRE